MTRFWTMMPPKKQAVTLVKLDFGKLVTFQQILDMHRYSRETRLVLHVPSSS